MPEVADGGTLQEPSVTEDRRADGTPATRAKVNSEPVAKTNGCMSGDVPEHGRHRSRKIGRRTDRKKTEQERAEAE